MDTLRNAALSGSLDVSDYNGRPIDQYLKADGSSYGKETSNGTLIGIVATVVVVVLILVSVGCYMLRRKRVGITKAEVDGMQMSDQYGQSE